MDSAVVLFSAAKRVQPYTYSKSSFRSSFKSYSMQNVNGEKKEKEFKEKMFRDEEAENERRRLMAGAKAEGRKCVTGEGCVFYKPEPVLVVKDSDCPELDTGGAITE